MIEVRDVAKRFGENVVLDGVDLEIPEGELMAVIGASGAGKSLLLRMMLGLEQPDRGRIRVGEVRMTGRSHGEMRHERPNVGVVFQHGALFDDMTALQNVAFPLRVRFDLDGAELRERAMARLEEVELAGAAGRRPDELSGGEQTRVGIARAVATEPDYLFLDEPLTGLDPRTARTIAGFVDRVTADRDVTAVLVSHEVGFVRDLSDRIAFLHGGGIRFLGTADELDESDDDALRDLVGAVR